MKLELGTYVDCSKLTLEQVEKLFNKWVELVGDNCDELEEDLSDFSKSDHYLVYCKNYQDEVVMWFWYDSYNAETEAFYEDFFPEELEATPATSVKRVKQIDLERNNKTFEIKLAEFEVDLVNLGEGYTLTELNELLNSKLSAKGNDYHNDQFEKDGEPKFTIYQGGNCEVYQSYKVESEEDYQARVQREKDLNDMYNADISQLNKKLLHVQQDLDDINVVLLTIAFPHEKLEEIKQILEG